MDSYGCSAVPPVPSSAYSSRGTYADRTRTSWPKTDCANTYKVYRSTGTAQGPYTELVGETNQLFLDFFVNDETVRYFAVFACNEIGCSNGGKIATAGGYAFLPTIKINEITVGNVDMIELYNYGSTDIVLQDYTLTSYSDDLESAVVFSLYAYTLDAGDYVILDERMHRLMLNHIFFNKDIPWSLGQSGAAVLADANGYGLDFVRWGDSAIPPLLNTTWLGDDPPAVPLNEYSLGRYPNAWDTDHGEDWCLQNQSLLSSNTFCVKRDNARSSKSCRERSDN